jgi:hypothetical protein
MCLVIEVSASVGIGMQLYLEIVYTHVRRVLMFQAKALLLE